MLEYMALAATEWSETASYVVNYLLLIIGGLIGGFTNRSELSLTRAPYFAQSAVILICTSLVSVLMLPFLIPAMRGGFLWVVLLAEFGALVAAGFWFARIAIARSRDAYGTGDRAALAFIPLANLWLLFTPSRSTEAELMARPEPALSAEQAS